MHDGSDDTRGRVGETDGLTLKKQMTPFQRVLVDTSRRREANAKREKAMALKADLQVVDVQRILARGDCLSQHESNRMLVRDPQLYLRWTPIFPHPLPTSYELFENERRLRRIGVLPPEDRVLAAAAAGYAWCVEELFAQGCPIETKKGSGITPLHVAATRNDPDTVRVLLNMKADVNPTNLSGATPLSCAIGGEGGPDGQCATLLRASGGLLRLVEDTVGPGSILDVPLQRPRRVMDDSAENSGRMVYTGQY
ncbi:unnamed protein product [Scytosiphon promiscuus]